MAIWTDPRRRLEQLKFWSRVKNANEFLLSINAFVGYLWIRKTVGQQCTCVKDISEQADKKCSICYGTKIVGGYERWGFNTVSMDSQFPGLQINSKLRIRTDFTPHRIILDRGWESGEIITPYVEPRPNLGWIGFNADDYVYDSEHSGIDYYWQEYGKDEWNSIINFPSLAVIERYVKFKIVIRRDNQTIKSPVWGMIQVRNQNSVKTELNLSRERPPQRKDRSRETYGNSEEEGGLKMWTINAPVIDDNDFIELRTGLRENKRYRVTSFEQSEPGGILLSQHMTLRVLQQNEIYYKVF